MNPATKRAAALALLKKTGMRPTDYAPPLFRLAWRAGIAIPPPHFVAFWRLTLSAALYFGVLMFVFLSLLGFERTAFSTVLLLGSAAGGLLFGFAIGAHYAHGRRKYRLPAWDQIMSDGVGDSAGNRAGK